MRGEKDVRSWPVFSARIPPDLAAQIKSWADAEEITYQRAVRLLLEAGLLAYATGHGQHF